MRRLGIITALMLLIAAVTIWAAPGDKTLFVTQPRFTTYSTNRAAIPFTKQALASYTSNTHVTNNVYRRVLEVKNAKGIMTMYVNANGKIVIGGNPSPLTASSVYPTAGATAVSNGTWFNYSSTVGGYNYWGRINKPVPYIAFNKGDHPTGSISGTGGSTATPSSQYTYFSNFSGATGTTYTMSFTRSTYMQTDGEITSSCGAMSDAAGVCTSTFTMR
jgi:hypothetical protein